jgi:tetratricopeptide (TPR) repeat protein
MRVFICHAAEDADVARSIELALREEGHFIFLDRTSLPAGESYNDQIRAAIDASDLLLFLLSPEAVAKGRYTLTELELAEQRWPEPSGHVLPVMVRATDLAAVPQYAKAITILEPQGNVAAAVAMAVERLSKRRRWRRLGPRVLLTGLVILLGSTGAAWWTRRLLATRAEVQDLLQQGALLRDGNHYAEAWAVLARAGALSPGRRDVVLARESLAMAWLENVRVRVGQETFVDVADRVQPSLAQCAVARDTRRAADCLAHLGWADFLRSREGVGGLDPVQQYRRALALDPDNPYAHALWGFQVLASGGGLAEAQARFAKALAAGRARAYVRQMQMAGLLYRHDPGLETEAVRVANEIRATGQAVPSGPPDAALAGRLWDVYYDRLINGVEEDRFVAALAPADHLATFRWLFPEEAIPQHRRNLYLFMLARFQEEAGQHAEALTRLRALRLSLASEGGGGGRLVDETTAAIRRLSRR